jgi:DNA-nicking Smr family endonuclease
LLTPHESALWRAVAKSIAPLPGRTLPAEQAPPPASKPAADRASHAPAPRHAPKRAAPVADRAGEKRVRRGRVEIAASFDLHGFTEVRAHAALKDFLLNEQAAGARAVIVITGKGGAGEDGVLKRRLPAWLEAPDLRPHIAGYAEAHRRHGGAGAYYVFLKRTRED